MPRNSSGTYTLPAGNPVVTNTVISSTVQNNTTSDIATALTQSLASTGVTTPSANLPMGTFRHTGVGNAVARTDYASAAQVQDGSITYLTTVAGTDTITAVAALSMTALAAGQTFRFISAGANTTAVTININGIGAKSITKNGTSALVANDIVSGSLVTINYDGTRFQIVGPPSVAVIRSPRTANTILGLSDNGTLIDITSGTFSQTITLAATLGAGWNVWYRNSGTGYVTITPTSPDTCDGLTSFIMYPGEERRFTNSGTALFSEIITPAYLTLTTTTAVIIPPGYSAYDVECIGAGAGGGGGQGAAGGAIRQGGSGAGGGARPKRTISGIAAGTSVTATIGAGGNGGAGGISGAGSNGTAGGNTTFGTYLTAYGGGYGHAGDRDAATDFSGGGGGGSGGAGANALAGVAVGGSPQGATWGGATLENNTGGGGGASLQGSNSGGCAEWGGAAGGWAATAGTTAGVGGSSIFGAGGGGAGGGLTAGNTELAGSAGGATKSYTAGGGGAGGAANGGAGTAGAAGSNGDCGAGGGGGGAQDSGTGGVGGAGGAPGGGGGGGGAGTSTGGAGGAGARGEIRIAFK